MISRWHYTNSKFIPLLFVKLYLILYINISDKSDKNKHKDFAVTVSYTILELQLTEILPGM